MDVYGQTLMDGCMWTNVGGQKVSSGWNQPNEIVRMDVDEHRTEVDRCRIDVDGRWTKADRC